MGETSLIIILEVLSQGIRKVLKFTNRELYNFRQGKIIGILRFSFP
jgi:hypothetical protein